MSRPSQEAIIEQELNRIFKSKTATNVSEAHKEIEANHAYINQKQLKDLVALHDTTFKEKCVEPLRKLYHKYSDLTLQEGDLQNWAELVERDVRILEATMDKVRDNQSTI